MGCSLNELETTPPAVTLSDNATKHLRTDNLAATLFDRRWICSYHGTAGD